MTTLDKCERMRGALWGMFVGDALAMPAHWYYDVAALRRDYGTIRDYQQPRVEHPNSIMSLASTSGAGRGDQAGSLVGSVILHGKKEFWQRHHIHYHHSLRSGDNTLNLLCVRVLMGTMNELRCYDADAFLEAYVQFMTTPGSHNDTYAESYHRDFFANYARGVPLRQCAGAEGHDTASIGGLVSQPVVMFGCLHDGVPEELDKRLLEHLRLTHQSVKLERYALALAQLLKRAMEQPARPLRTLACATAESLRFPLKSVLDEVEEVGRTDLDVIGGLLSPACYIEHSFPAVLYLAARYSDDIEGALVANTNVGGDNCHRGAVLGALLGASLGRSAIPPRWLQGLAEREALEQEIETFVTAFV